LNVLSAVLLERPLRHLDWVDLGEAKEIRSPRDFGVRADGITEADVVVRPNGICVTRAFNNAGGMDDMLGGRLRLPAEGIVGEERGERCRNK